MDTSDVKPAEQTRTEKMTKLLLTWGSYPPETETCKRTLPELQPKQPVKVQATSAKGLPLLIQDGDYRPGTKIDTYI